MIREPHETRPTVVLQTGALGELRLFFSIHLKCIQLGKKSKSPILILALASYHLILGQVKSLWPTSSSTVKLDLMPRVLRTTVEKGTLTTSRTPSSPTPLLVPEV